TPRSQSCCVEYRCCFLHPIGASDVDRVCVSVPDKFDGGKEMRPSEIHAADAWPVAWKVPLLPSNHSFLDREDPTRTKNRNALRPGFQFVGWIRRDNSRTLLVGVMVHVINGHCRDVPVV